MSAVVIVLLLAANAFFVAYEFALVASRRARLEAFVAEGRLGAVAALEATASLSRHMAGVQVGVAGASLGLGAVAEPAVGRVLEAVAAEVVGDGAARVLGFGVAFVIVIALHGVLGELVPKRIALAKAERALLVLAPPMRVFELLTRPLIALVNAAAGLVLRMVRVPRREELLVAGTAREFARLIDASRDRGLIAEPQHRLLSGAIEFRNRPVADVMVPRPEIVAAPLTATPSQLEALLTDTGRTRVPLYGRDLDDAVGFVHAKDLVGVAAADRGRALSRTLVRRLLLVRDNRPLGEVLAAMQRSRVHLAGVRDRDGTLVGLVTLEDVLEELVGQISDETDGPATEPAAAPDGAAR